MQSSRMLGVDERLSGSTGVEKVFAPQQPVTVNDCFEILHWWLLFYDKVRLDYAPV